MAGHPAKKDPDIARLFKAMRSAVELVRDMDGRLTEDGLLCLKAAALGMMIAYSELTGLPSPIEVVTGKSIFDKEPVTPDNPYTAEEVELMAGEPVVEDVELPALDDILSALPQSKSWGDPNGGPKSTAIRDSHRDWV